MAWYTGKKQEERKPPAPCGAEQKEEVMDKAGAKVGENNNSDGDTTGS